MLSSQFAFMHKMTGYWNVLTNVYITFNPQGRETLNNFAILRKYCVSILNLFPAVVPSGYCHRTYQRTFKEIKCYMPRISQRDKFPVIFQT